MFLSIFSAHSLSFFLSSILCCIDDVIVGVFFSSRIKYFMSGESIAHQILKSLNIIRITIAIIDQYSMS